MDGFGRTGPKPLARRHRDLFDRIANFPALDAAAQKAALGKRKKPGAASFLADREKELLRLERTLREGTYKPGKYVKIELFDPKHRIVSAAPFRDRVVHHAVCEVVAPIFERGFITHTFANRVGKGAHRAVDTYERYRDRHRHVLRCDVFRYFPAIDHAILKHDLRRRLACEPTLALLDKIIYASNRQEPVDLIFPGDDLLSPLERRRGLPIGNLTSQFFANLYLDPLDHFCTEVLGAPYLRYVDDFALFHDDIAVLKDWRARITRFLEGRRLKLHPKKTWTARTSEPTEFLGYILLPNGLRRLPEANVTRFHNRLRGMRDQLRAGTIDEAKVRTRIQAWEAHASFAHTRKLRNAILGEKVQGRRKLG